MIDRFPADWMALSMALKSPKACDTSPQFQQFTLLVVLKAYFGAAELEVPRGRNPTGQGVRNTNEPPFTTLVLLFKPGKSKSY